MARCEVHDEELLGDRVEVRRGMPPAPPAGYFEAKERLFPHANSWIMGGCMVDDGIYPNDDVEDVDHCPKCRIAERSWFEGRQSEEFWQP